MRRLMMSRHHGQTDIIIKIHRDKAVVMGVTPQGISWLFSNIEYNWRYPLRIDVELVTDFVDDLRQRGLIVDVI